MSQNKSVYTRRFNQLKRALRDYFDNSVEFSETASLRWSSDACIVAHDGSLGFTLYFRDVETDEYDQAVSIVKTPTCSKGGLIGIHVRDTDLHHMLDMIEVALRDGFESIYVESIGSLKQA